MNCPAKIRLFLTIAFLLSATARADESPVSKNLLLNPQFDFHAFTDHRDGQPGNYSSHNVAFWNTDAWGDITVVRQSHVDPAIRPAFSAGNLVAIGPGKRFRQFFTLPEAGLAHGEHVSLTVYGHQSQPGALVARVVVLKLDSQEGTWSPAAFGCGDKRTFSKHARGELVAARTYPVQSKQTGRVELKIEGAEIVGRFHTGRDSCADDVNTVGIRVEFENTGQEGDVWVYAPCLTSGRQAKSRLPQAREMIPYYRHIPRTIQKLWKGEPIHVIVMGSSIDRGSANPPLYLYDEDPASKTFKQPLSDRLFEGEKIGRPELDPYFGWWQHYFGYSGRLKLELMRKYHLTADKICLNVMACDGSCVGEAHSGLTAYCSLSLPPAAGDNGHKSGKSWRELYPQLFARPEGPRPDLVIFGSGANEKTDTPDEAAVFEGMIRWIQQHYPGTEFLFCMWQNRGGYTPNTGDLKALALRYQIPCIDFGRVQDDVTAWCNMYALAPDGGHPAAAGHYLWFKQLERAFECWDPIRAGQVQLQLPQRVHPNSYGWEGEIVTFDHESPRIRKNMFVFEDTAINCWGMAAKDSQPVPYVDGRQQSCRRNSPNRSLRNSLFRHGRTQLGDRHVLEIVGKEARLTWVDAKICPNRRFLGVENARWDRSGARPTPFKSDWGAPYGTHQVSLAPDKPMTIDVVATDLSVAYVDTPGGGTLRVLVDKTPRLEQPTNCPFVDQAKQKHYMENRQGILGLGFGLHTVRVEAVGKPVVVLGIFTYDSRSNRANERRVTGYGSAGETVVFSLPFKARPVVFCHEALRVKPEDITPAQVTFSGQGTGSYEIVGE